MTSSGLDDFFIPADDGEIPEIVTAPTSAQDAAATRGIHAPSVPAAQVPGVAFPQIATAPSGSPPVSGPVAAHRPQAPTAPADVRVTPPTSSPPAGPVAGPPPAGLAPTDVPEAGTGPAPPGNAAPMQQAQTIPARQPSRTREQQLSAALATFMRVSADVEAAALVSLDGFIMASALPEGMHEDRVGAMSAAILGLGERAAAELGRGRLTQVFIEGDTGYVLLMAAGDRAVLTALARLEAKLGLLLYDMRDVAEAIADILG